MLGVIWMMLDCLGDEVVCVMIIVCYVLESCFFVYNYDGGEEFIVLEGVFEDEYGIFLVGFYICNLLGFSYMLGFVEGCVIFVKLW